MGATGYGWAGTGRRGGGRVGLVQAAVAAAILIALSLVRAGDPVVLESLRLAGFDQLQRWYPREAEPVPVRVVDVDEASLSRIGQWPWPRSVLADLSTRLTEAGAAVVVFDMLFAEPDRGERGADGATASDRRFAEALSAGRGVLGMVLVAEPTGAERPTKAGIAVVGADPVPGLAQFPGAVGALAPLAAAAKGEGAINVVPDRDGVVRRLPLFLAQGQRAIPSLSAEALRVAQGAAGHVLRSEPDGRITARIGNLMVPLDARGEIWLRFAAAAEGARTPAWQVLDGSGAAATMKGAIVLVGSSAAGLKDLRATPVAQAVAGVDIQAEAIAGMLLGQGLIRPTWAALAEAGYAALIVLLAMALAAWRGLPAAAAATLAGLGGAAVTAALAFSGEGLLLDASYPMLAVLLAFAGQSAVLYQRLESEQRRVRDAFQHYLSPVLVERLAARPDQLVLGGETRRLTVLFCDIRGFSRRAGGLDPQVLTAFVNSVMTPLSDAVLESGGTVDKFMGDGLMAFWNAPLDEPDHAARACAAALDMAGRMPAINQALEAVLPAAMLPVEVGIGIDTGDCCVGNFGSTRRFDYSALGETVNFAARFEGLSRIYGVPIVVGEATRAAAPALAMIPLDETVVRGAVRPVTVHALLGDAEQASAGGFPALSAAHDDLRRAMAAEDRMASEAALERCRTLDADGRLAQFHAVMAARIAAGGPLRGVGL
ncbi:CHASE2 domain-containing protein [Allostella humosa]|uniref:CHASE2 domain-containing protein n=1 Tax=Stella humosa TaxID=94 RepID=UPI001153A0BE|nr:adenylate/guanylate cyclase domain-containing protein [Stella humosa]